MCAMTNKYEVGRYGNRFCIEATIEPVPPKNASVKVMAVCDELEDAEKIARALNASAPCDRVWDSAPIPVDTPLTDEMIAGFAQGAEKLLATENSATRWLPILRGLIRGAYQRGRAVEAAKQNSTSQSSQGASR